MKKQYLKQVSNALDVPYKKRKEILRDLNEIFTSGQAQGDTEQQIITRLGSPIEFAKSMEERIGSQHGRRGIVRSLLAICVLVLEYMLCRYAFFAEHGMKSMPLYLFILGVIVLVISAVCKAKIIPAVTLLGYIIGFFTGAIFRAEGTDPGGGATSNMWIIWGGVFVACIVLGIGVEVFADNKSKHK